MGKIFENYNLFVCVSKMGYDASVYLIYGVSIKYNSNSLKEELLPILSVIVPDLMEQYGYEEAFSCFDDEPHANGYYCLNFTDYDNKRSELFISCYYHRHVSARGKDDSLEVELPSDEVKEKFEEWLIENDIQQKPKFYTKLYESY